MRAVDDEIRFAATDLANHVACRHLTALDLARVEGHAELPSQTAWLAAAMQRRGEEHERDYVHFLRRTLPRVVDLREAPLDAAGYAATRAAMRARVDAILQAPMGAGRWSGRADVLRRADRPSELGSWSYEPYDTKLARETRGSAILQLSHYADLVAGLQGIRPAHMHVVTPGKPFLERTYRVDDFFAYYAFVRRRFTGFVEMRSDTYPDPVPHCEICRWAADCRRRLRDDDHLSFVAGLRSLHAAELRDWDVTTLAALGSMTVPLPHRPQRVSVDSLMRVRNQARLQLESRTSGQRVHELLPVVPGEGFCRLPLPSPGDIFFDLEGDPFVGESGREFLFGYAYRDDDGGWRYVGQWALDATEERQAFESFVGFVIARLRLHPDLHIFHYAPYEPAALRRLMGRHAVCEDEVDGMLRAELFVDLYAVVRQALRASVERYSIKDLEPFYGFQRQIPLADVGAHLQAVQWRLEFDDGGLITADTWRYVEGYNRDDCLSAAALRDWLESLRAGIEATGAPVPRPLPVVPEAPEELQERQRAVAAVMARLLANVPDEEAERSCEQQGRWLLAQLLEFHRREDKAVWWEFFRLADLAADDALDEASAIAGLEFVERIGGTKRCPIDRYRYPSQELTWPRGKVRSGRELRVGDVERFDPASSTIDIKKTTKSAEIHPSVVFFHQRFNPDVLQDALLAFGASVAEAGFGGVAARAAQALILNRPPALRPDTPWSVEGESVIARAIRLAAALNGALLPIQGPPGTGKTHTGAHVAVALVQRGLKVGVTGTSHQVIRHFLDTIVEVAAMAHGHEPAPVRCVQKVSDGEQHADSGLIHTTPSNGEVLAALTSGEANIAAGTVWLWARPEFSMSVDVLIVDEAGQMSLANVLAAAAAARNLILLGDPQQLEQPLKGSHPIGTDVSALQHVLGAHKTIPEDRGLFLAETWRLAPALCEFTSELFYEGRLQSRPGLDRQRIDGPFGLNGAGLWFLPVAHVGNQNCSLEEADQVAALVRRLIDGTHTWTDAMGVARRIAADDVIVVAPYNAQVSAIQQRVPGVLVGTVDRFQGREAAVVIYSMTTSTPEDAPRGMEFLYSLNRLNVATSRARCAVVLVANPRLFEVDCQTRRQMQLANAYCRYLDLAKELTLVG